MGMGSLWVAGDSVARRCGGGVKAKRGCDEDHEASGSRRLSPRRVAPRPGLPAIFMPCSRRPGSLPGDGSVEGKARDNEGALGKIRADPEAPQPRDAASCRLPLALRRAPDLGGRPAMDRGGARHRRRCVRAGRRLRRRRSIDGFCAAVDAGASGGAVPTYTVATGGENRPP